MVIYENFFVRSYHEMLQGDQEVQPSPFYIDSPIDIAVQPWSVHCECAVKHSK